MQHDKTLYVIWALDRALLTPLTHQRTGHQTWMPRRFTPKWLAAHPWLWCRKCGDALTTWPEVRRGVCEVCNADRWRDRALAEADAAGDPGLHTAQQFTCVRCVSAETVAAVSKHTVAPPGALIRLEASNGLFLVLAEDTQGGNTL